MTPANKLFTKTAFRKVPALYATDGVPETEKRAFVKIFSNFSDHRHYIFEYNPETGIAFVLTTNQDVIEFGYINLNELQTMNNNFRGHGYPCPVWQRELHGGPTKGYTAADIREKHARGLAA